MRAGRFSGSLLLVIVSGCATPLPPESPIATNPADVRAPVVSLSAPPAAVIDTGGDGERLSPAAASSAAGVDNDIPVVLVTSTGLSGFWA